MCNIRRTLAVASFLVPHLMIFCPALLLAFYFSLNTIHLCLSSIFHANMTRELQFFCSPKSKANARSKYSLIYVWVAVTNINVFISFICFDSTLNPNNFGLVEKFHTEEMLHVHLFVLLSRGRRNFISSCIIVVSWFLVSFVMDLAIPSSIKTLEKKLLLIFIFRVCLST